MRRLRLFFAVLLVGASVASVPSPSTAAAPGDEEILDLAVEANSDVATVYRLYAAYLGREPDGGGLWFWVDQHRNGRSLASISNHFATSHEFLTSFGSLSDAAFVDRVYLSVLKRSPDAAGRSFWVGRLGSGLTRGEMMLQFSDSIEFQVSTGFLNDREIERLYRAVFLRSSDNDGRQFWLAQRASGRSIISIAAAFTSGPEFVGLYGALDDRAFVELIYRNVMGRPSDAPGREYWIGRLAGTLTRAEMMVGFSNSAEFQERIGLLDRTEPAIPAPPVPVSGGPSKPPDLEPPFVPPILLPPEPITIPPPVFPCGHKANEVSLVPDVGSDDYILSLHYSYVARNRDCSDFEALRPTVNGIEGWEVKRDVGSNYYGLISRRLELVIPAEALDDDHGLAIDVTYPLMLSTGRKILEWHDYLLLPLRHEITMGYEPDPLPYEQQAVTVDVHVAVHQDAPNRELTVLVETAKGCEIAGVGEVDGLEMASGVGPLEFQLELDLRNTSGWCYIKVEVAGNDPIQPTKLDILRLVPNVDDFRISGSSHCPDDLCQTEMRFDFVPTGASYWGHLVPLAREYGMVQVTMDPEPSGLAGDRTLDFDHAYAAGFCAWIYSFETGNLTSVETPRRCFAPAAGEWLEVPVPEGRFN